MTDIQAQPQDEGVVLNEGAYNLLSACVGRLEAKYDALEAMVGEYNSRIAALEAETQAPDVNQYLLEAIQALAQSGMALNQMLLEGQKEIAGFELDLELASTPTKGSA